MMPIETSISQRPVVFVAFFRSISMHGFWTSCYSRDMLADYVTQQFQSLIPTPPFWNKAGRGSGNKAKSFYTCTAKPWRSTYIYVHNVYSWLPSSHHAQVINHYIRICGCLQHYSLLTCSTYTLQCSRPSFSR